MFPPSLSLAGPLHACSGHRRHTHTHLVGGEGHANLVADAQEQEPALGAVDGDLADELVKDLRVELAADGADARLARLSLLQLCVELLLQVDDVQARGRAACVREGVGGEGK